MNVLTKWKVAVCLAAIFLAGGVSGFFVAGKVEKQKASKPLDTKELSKEVAMSFRDRCHARLNLTPEQAKKIDGIIERYSTKILSVHDEKRTCVRQMCDERNSRILAVLTPQQQEAFEQMAKERKEAWRSRENSRTKAPGPKSDKADCGTNGPGPGLSNKIGVTSAFPDSLEPQK